MNILNTRDVDYFCSEFVMNCKNQNICNYFTRNLRRYILNEEGFHIPYDKDIHDIENINGDGSTPEWVHLAIKNENLHVFDPSLDAVNDLRAIMTDALQYFETGYQGDLDHIKAIALPDLFTMIEEWHIELKEQYVHEFIRKYAKEMSYREALSLLISQDPSLGTLYPEQNGDSTLIEAYKDGYFMVQIHTKNGLEREGTLMNHCVGGYHKDVAQGDCHIYSLRNQYNIPIVTIETRFMTPPIIYNELISPFLLKKNVVIQQKMSSNNRVDNEIFDIYKDFFLKRNLFVKNIGLKHNIITKDDIDFNQFSENLLNQLKNYKEFKNHVMSAISIFFNINKDYNDKYKPISEAVKNYINTVDMVRSEKSSLFINDIEVHIVNNSVETKIVYNSMLREICEKAGCDGFTMLKSAVEEQIKSMLSHKNVIFQVSFLNDLKKIDLNPFLGMTGLYEKFKQAEYHSHSENRMYISSLVGQIKRQVSKMKDSDEKDKFMNALNVQLPRLLAPFTIKAERQVNTAKEIDIQSKSYNKLLKKNQNLKKMGTYKEESDNDDFGKFSMKI